VYVAGPPRSGRREDRGVRGPLRAGVQALKNVERALHAAGEAGGRCAHPHLPGAHRRLGEGGNGPRRDLPRHPPAATLSGSAVQPRCWWRRGWRQCRVGSRKWRQRKAKAEIAKRRAEGRVGRWGFAVREAAPEPGGRRLLGPAAASEARSAADGPRSPHLPTPPSDSCPIRARRCVGLSGSPAVLQLHHRGRFPASPAAPSALPVSRSLPRWNTRIGRPTGWRSR